MNKMNSVRGKAAKAVDDVIEEATVTARRARSGTSSAKARASAAAHDIADDLREVADETRSRARRAASRASSAAHDVVEDLRDRDMVADARDFARRNPGIVVAGALLTGAAIALLARRSDR